MISFIFCPVTDIQYFQLATCFAGDFSREDLAAAVFSMVLDDLAQTCLALAIANHQPSIIFCGSLLNHEVARHFLTKHFLAKSMTMAKDVSISTDTRLAKMCFLSIKEVLSGLVA